jgi:hypothetical protein
MGISRTVLIISELLLKGCAQVLRDGDFTAVKDLLNIQLEIPGLVTEVS